MQDYIKKYNSNIYLGNNTIHFTSAVNLKHSYYPDTSIKLTCIKLNSLHNKTYKNTFIITKDDESEYKTRYKPKLHIND